MEGVLKSDNIRKRRAISKHAVDGFHDDKGRGGAFSQALEAFFQITHVVVPEPDDLRPTQTASVIDACMGVAVDKDDISGPGQSGYRGKIGLITCREYDTGVAVIEFRKLALQETVTAVTAIGHPGARGSRALAIYCFM